MGENYICSEVQNFKRIVDYHYKNNIDDEVKMIQHLQKQI